MRSSAVRRLLTVSAIVALLPVIAHAQEAVLSGTVTDSTGGVLPGVTVTALHEASGNTFVTVTDERGTYRLPARAGVFKITVELTGFGTVTRSGLELLVGQQAVVNLQMAPSTVQETVTVTGEAPLIDTTNSRVGGNIDPRQMQELPVNGRNWVDLTLLAPGSRQNAVSETPVAGQGTTVQFQLNLDNQQVTNLVAVGFGQPRYSRDAIAEFVMTGRFDASQGHSSGVQVNAITKSGTNTPTGTFATYFRNDKFNAADHVTGTVLPYSDQQLSGTFGGPIVKDKFHYFGSYEHEREPQTYVYTTPYAHFNGSLTGTRLEDKEIARFDYQFSPQIRLAVRGTRYDNRLPYDPRYTGGSDKTPASAIGTNRRSEQILATLTQVLGNRALNEVKVGHDSFHWNQYSHITNPNSLVGQTPGFGAPNIQLRGLTLGQSHAITPQDIGQDNYLFRDDFTYSFTKGGRHDVKTGAEYIYNFTFETVCNQCMGVLDLQGGPVPANIESLFPNLTDVSTWNLAPLSPIARSYSRAIGMPHSPYSRPSGNDGFTEYAPRHDYAFWVQDDWQLSKSLTLNLGLRYDLSLNQYVNWVVFPPLLPSPRPNEKNNFGPRAGFAYSVNDNTVIRGGVGKYYAEVTGQPAVFTLRNVQQINPLILYDGRSDFASNPFNGPAPTYDQAATLLCSVSTAANCLRPSVSNFVAPDLRQPYSYQGSIGMQRQVGRLMAIEADYVFTGDRATLNATASRNINLAYNPATGANYPFSGAGADVTKRTYPTLGSLAVNRSDGKSNNHGLQTSVTKRMSNRWQAAATYTLAGQWTLDTLPLNPGCQYPVTLNAAGKSVCDVPITLAPDVSENKYYLTGDQRHRATFNGIWQLGYGFQLSGLYLFGDNGKATPTSGVDVRQTGAAPTAGNALGTGTVVSGRLRTNGTLIERNSFDRSNIHRVDLRVQRRFKLGGKAGIDGIFEMFNVFNHANYNSWVLNESARNYGQPQQDTNVAYAPRMLQLGFRATF